MGERLAEYDYRTLDEAAVWLDQPKWRRLKAQRELRAEQYATVAELERRGVHTMWAGYRTSVGIGVDRYIQDITRMHRRSRAAPKTGFIGFEQWIPERRCDHAFAVDAAGEVVHHDDPAAVRWCLGGWIAHSCMRNGDTWQHGQRRAQWWELSDDHAARAQLDHVWGWVPERTRAIVERVWRERVKSSDRKRIECHPLGYWWYLAPHLAARFLGVPYRRANCLPPLQLHPPVTFRWV